jgi:hypothetical protein
MGFYGFFLCVFFFLSAKGFLFHLNLHFVDKSAMTKDNDYHKNWGVPSSNVQPNITIVWVRFSSSEIITHISPTIHPLTPLSTHKLPNSHHSYPITNNTQYSSYLFTFHSSLPFLISELQIILLQLMHLKCYLMKSKNIKGHLKLLNNQLVHVQFNNFILLQYVYFSIFCWICSVKSNI